MRERPILFSTPMIKAIIDGRKTMTRRLLKKQPLDILPMNVPNQWITLDVKEPEPHGKVIKCRFGVPGDRLWVRETFSLIEENGAQKIIYRADYPEIDSLELEECGYTAWKPSIFLPHQYSRITLEITNIRVERLQEITEDEAGKEGIPECRKPQRDTCFLCPFEKELCNVGFSNLWDSINGKTYPWSSNPWVWVIQFKKLEAV